MTNSRLIIWDFDGVLFDSLKECIIVLQISLRLIEENFKIENNLDINNAKFKKETNELLIKMKPLRPFIIKGQDYIWQYLNLKKFNKNYETFSDYKKIFDTFFKSEQDQYFEFIFYKARKILQHHLKEHYYNIFMPFDDALKAFRESLKENTSYICSARDYFAIKYLLNHHNINVDKNKILAKDNNLDLVSTKLTKKEQIKSIVNKEKKFKEKFTLIEDQLSVPLSLLEEFPKIRIIYAKYGYGNNSEYDILNKSIFSIEKSSEIISFLSK